VIAAFVVMAGLDPAIHESKGVGHRVELGDDAFDWTQGR